MLKILIAGIKRSGSTLVYNMARLLAIETGGAVWAGSWEDYEERAIPRYDHHIIKIHHYDRELADSADAIVTTRRSLYDVARSAIRVGLCKDDPEHMIAFLRFEVANLRKYRSHRNTKFNLRYDVVTNFKSLAIGKMDGFFHSHAKEKVLAQLTKIKNYKGKGPHDPITLMHRKHMSRFNRKLPAYYRECIDSWFGDWQKENGYT